MWTIVLHCPTSACWLMVTLATTAKGLQGMLGALLLWLSHVQLATLGVEECLRGGCQHIMPDPNRPTHLCVRCPGNTATPHLPKRDTPGASI